MPSSTNAQSRATLLNLAYIAVFTALTIAVQFVDIPVGPTGTPIVLQNAVLILAGLILGWARGLAVSCLFLGLGLLGLPVLSGGGTTLSALAGMSVGYMVGYLLSPAIAGFIAYRAPAKNGPMVAVTYTLAGLAALACQYICGAIGFSYRGDIPLGEAFLMQGAFLPTDLLKLVAVILIALAVRKAFPEFRGTKTTDR